MTSLRAVEVYKCILIAVCLLQLCHQAASSSSLHPYRPLPLPASLFSPPLPLSLSPLSLLLPPSLFSSHSPPSPSIPIHTLSLFFLSLSLPSSLFPHLPALIPLPSSRSPSLCLLSVHPRPLLSVSLLSLLSLSLPSLPLPLCLSLFTPLCFPSLSPLSLPLSLPPLTPSPPFFSPSPSLPLSRSPYCSTYL